MGLVAEEMSALLRSDEISDACRATLQCFAILLVLAVISYVFFGVYFLCIDYHVCVTVRGIPSPLWFYCISVLMIFIGTIGTAIYHSATVTTEAFESIELHGVEGKKRMFWNLLHVIIAQLVLVTGGSIIMFGQDITCENLRHTGILLYHTKHTLMMPASYKSTPFMFRIVDVGGDYFT